MNRRNRTMFSALIAVFTLAIMLSSCSSGGGGSAPGGAAAITGQPQDQNVVQGDTATFTVTATGATGYQWQRSTDGGVNFSAVGGANAAGYTTGAATLADDGTQYRVVVHTDSGDLISSAATLSVAAAAPVAGWSAPAVISNLAAHAEYPKLAFDGSGNAMAVWVQNNDIWAAYYSITGGWSTAAVIESDSGIAASPDVAMDGAGNALAVWQQGDGTRNNIWANRFTPTAGWEGAGLLESGNGDARLPRVVMDAAGHGLAVWSQNDGTKWHGYAAAYSGGWGAAGAVDNSPGGVYNPPDVAMNAAGQAMLVWATPPTASSTVPDVWACSYSTGGGWGSAVTLESDTSGGSDVGPQVAVGPSGNATAVWLRLDSATGLLSVRAATCAAGGSWGTAELIESSDAGTAEMVDVAMDDSGNAIAVWMQHTSGYGGYSQIWANRRAAGGAWGGEVMLETTSSATDSFPSSDPKLAFAADGSATVVWTSGGGPIAYATWTGTGGWGVEKYFDTAAAGGSNGLRPQIAFDSAGHGFALWQMTVTTSNNVYGIMVSRYE